MARAERGRDSGSPLELREPSPCSRPPMALGAAPAEPDEGGTEPGEAPDAEQQRAERIEARRRRVGARRRREELGIVEEEEEKEEEKGEKEEEEQSKSLRLIEDTEKALASLLCHGTRLVTLVRADTDLSAAQSRAQRAQQKRDRLERLEQEAKKSTERFGEISSRWALAKDTKIPQELRELLREQQEQWELLLRDKNRLIGDLRGELQQQDEQYQQARAEQAQQLQLLLDRMEEQTRNVLLNFRHSLRHIEETLEQERQEMLERKRREWNDTIQAHTEQELQFLRDRTAKAEQFEQQLNELQEQDLESHDRMKLQLEKDVQYLEQKLQQLKGLLELNAVKLEYNVQVLRQQLGESRTLRALQSRRSNRLQLTLSALKSKLAAQEKKSREELQSLESDRRRLAGQHRELRSRMRHLSARGVERLRQLWLLNAEEAWALLAKALEANRLLHEQQLGIPWEEPPPGILRDVSPPGPRPRNRPAGQVAKEPLTETSSGKQERRERKQKEGKEGEESSGNAEDGANPMGNISKGTTRRILELLREELGFLMENKELEPLQELGEHQDPLLGLSSIFEALRIKDERDLFQLVEFFLQYKALEGTDSQQEQLQPHRGSLSSSPTLDIHVDDVLKILKEFLKDFTKLREDSPAPEAPQIRYTSRHAEFWASLPRLIPEPTLRLWDALDRALLEYHHVLSRRARLLSEASLLQRHNCELGMLLREHLGSSATP